MTKPRCSPQFAAGVAGFSRLELVVVICVAGVIAVAATERFLYLEERAEKAALEGVLAGLKMGLQIRMAELLMTNQQAGAGVLENENPVRWLQEPPGNYAGEYTVSAKSGYWYYAVPEHQLVYLPRFSAYLDTGRPGNKELWFRIAIRYEMSTVTGGRIPAGIGLVPAHSFKWF